MPLHHFLTLNSWEATHTTRASSPNVNLISNHLWPLGLTSRFKFVFMYFCPTPPSIRQPTSRLPLLSRGASRVLFPIKPATGSESSLQLRSSDVDFTSHQSLPNYSWPEQSDCHCIRIVFSCIPFPTISPSATSSRRIPYPSTRRIRPSMTT